MLETRERPTIEDVRRAAGIIAPHLALPTPLVYQPALSERIDAHVSLKLESATPISAFKIRGGLYLVSQLDARARASGVVTASTGNHGQSIAYAAGVLGVPAVVVVPRAANRDKVANIERLGARVIHEGAHYDEAHEWAAAYAAEHEMFYVDAANEPDLTAGVGTAALEVLTSQQPDTEVVIVPVGGGSGACGWITVRDGLGSSLEVWGVQSAQAPAAHDSWRGGQPVTRPNETMADGVATGVGFVFTQAILRDGLNDFVLVDDRRIEEAVVTLLESAHTLAETAGACSTAAALQEADRLRGRKVVLVISGSNITRPQLERFLAR